MGLDYCLHNNQVSLIVIETDSLLAQQVLNGNWEVPWLMAWDVRYIKSRMISKEVDI